MMVMARMVYRLQATFRLFPLSFSWLKDKFIIDTPFSFVELELMDTLTNTHTFGNRSYRDWSLNLIDETGSKKQTGKGTPNRRLFSHSFASQHVPEVFWTGYCSIDTTRVLELCIGLVHMSVMHPSLWSACGRSGCR